MATLQILQTKRPVVFYTERFAIRGDLHINSDAPDDDMLDNSRDFFAVTNASLFPLRPLSTSPTKKVPFLALNRTGIFSYHAHTAKKAVAV